MSDTAQSPFAAPAQAAPAPAAPAPVEVGDTSFMDGVASQPPLIKGCVCQAILKELEEKTSEKGTAFLNLAVQLYPGEGQNVVYEDGTKVPMGKRLTSTIFLSAKDAEKFQRTARTAKNLALALRNVPLDNNADNVYKAWPPTQKMGVIQKPDGSFAVSTASLQPLSQWVDGKVMVQITKGKDMDGNPRNEFSLLAASTPQKAAKGK